MYQIPCSFSENSEYLPTSTWCLSATSYINNNLRSLSTGRYLQVHLRFQLYLKFRVPNPQVPDMAPIPVVWLYSATLLLVIHNISTGFLPFGAPPLLAMSKVQGRYLCKN